MNTNNKNKRIFVGVFAVMLIVGLISMYAPMLFTPTRVEQVNEPVDQSATLSQQLPSGDELTATSSDATTSLEGFSGLNEESKSLDDLGN